MKKKEPTKSIITGVKAKWNKPRLKRLENVRSSTKSGGTVVFEGVSYS